MKHSTYSDLLKPLLALVASAVISIPLSAGEAAKDAPTDILGKEHDIIGKMSDFAGKTAVNIRSGDAVDWEELGQLLDFFRNFADQCHHLKEEELLFPELRKLKVDTVVIDLLVKQHEEGRILLGGIADILKNHESPLSGTTRQSLAEYLSQYSQLMQRHIKLENEYLWPRVSQALDEAAKTRITEEFHATEEKLGEGFHEKYHSIAMKLLKEP